MNVKKWIVVIIFICLAIFSSVSCAKTPVAELSDDDVIALYNRAKEAYGWFDLTTIPHDAGSYVKIDGIVYFEVVQPGITSKRALADYLSEIFTGDVMESLMATSADRFVERGGKLYVLPADRGVDLFKGAESYEVVKISDGEMKLTVTVEVYGDPEQKNVVGHERYDFFLEFSGNRWRFKNFASVR